MFKKHCQIRDRLAKGTCRVIMSQKPRLNKFVLGGSNHQNSEPYTSEISHQQGSSVWSLLQDRLDREAAALQYFHDSIPSPEGKQLQTTATQTEIATATSVPGRTMCAASSSSALTAHKSDVNEPMLCPVCGRTFRGTSAAFDHTSVCIEERKKVEKLLQKIAVCGDKPTVLDSLVSVDDREAEIARTQRSLIINMWKAKHDSEMSIEKYVRDSYNPTMQRIFESMGISCPMGCRCIHPDSRFASHEELYPHVEACWEVSFFARDFCNSLIGRAVPLRCIRANSNAAAWSLLLDDNNSTAKNGEVARHITVGKLLCLASPDLRVWVEATSPPRIPRHISCATVMVAGRDAALFAGPTSEEWCLQQEAPTVNYNDNILKAEELQSPASHRLAPPWVASQPTTDDKGKLCVTRRADGATVSLDDSLAEVFCCEFDVYFV